MQNGDECYCGNSVPLRAIVIKDAKCNKRCPGDKEKKCGGKLAMNIFLLKGAIIKPIPIPVVAPKKTSKFF